ncbi:MAG: hypothetical protein ACFB02_01815 [Mastigocoleus sp.]
MKILEEYPTQDNISLLTKMNQYFKDNIKQVKGVTGMIHFDKNGDDPKGIASSDRINPPAEIVTVKWDDEQHKWFWGI